MIALCLSLFVGPVSVRAGVRDLWLSSAEGGDFEIHGLVYEPETETVADVLYLHGFGDESRNHLKTFAVWARQGIRTIAFDFPSHGRTRSLGGAGINSVDFGDLAGMAARVENLEVQDRNRPLVLAGWSTGGLLAVRMAQALGSRLSREIKGLVLFAPGVAVRPCVGDFTCHITNPTLTHDRALDYRAAKPDTPLKVPFFAGRIAANAALSWLQGLPAPALVWVAGNHTDRYVITPKVKLWVLEQRKAFSSGVTAYQCPGARHELDNELPGYGRDQVRVESARFIRATALGGPETGSPSGRPCTAF